MNFFIVFVAVFSVQNVYCKKLPSFINYCRQDLSRPQLLQCFKEAIEVVRPRLAKGIPELLIPPMNPLSLPEAGLDTGDNFRARFRNIEIFYADSFVIKHLDVDLEKFMVELDLGFPKMRIKSQYNIDGRILILQLKGAGPADGNFTDISARMVINGSLYDKGGKRFVQINHRSVDMDLGRPVFKFDGIFRDNVELNEQTNRIINENIVDIMDELKPVIYDTVTSFVFGLVERIFRRFSFDELFPINAK